MAYNLPLSTYCTHIGYTVRKDPSLFNSLLINKTVSNNYVPNFLTMLTSFPKRRRKRKKIVDETIFLYKELGNS